MTLSTNRRMSLEEYLTYDDGTDARYELVDGVLVEMGAENQENILIASFLFSVLLQFVPYYLIQRGTEIAVPSRSADTRYPDLIILTEAGAAALPPKTRSLITFEMPAPALVVEVVSPGTENHERDYIDKRREYAARGIPEYWLIDPELEVVTVCTLVDGQYQSAEFRGYGAIASPTFPTLNLKAIQILQAGQ